MKKEKKGKVIKREDGKITCLLLEHAESELIEQQMAGQLCEKFVYQFEQGGKIIRGLTASGMNECVRYLKVEKGGFVPQYTDPEIIQSPTGKWLIWIRAKNPKTMEENIGGSEFDPNIRFSFRAALTIAKRNALAPIIPTETKLRFIDFCLKKGITHILQVDTKPAESGKLTAENQKKMIEINPDEQKNKAIAGVYAVLNFLKLDSVKATAYFKKIYKTEHFRSLSVEQLREIYKTLSTCKTDKSKFEDLKLAIEER